MIFGTAKQLAMLNRGLKVKYQHHTVNVTSSYRYLGVDVDPSLTFSDYFMTLYKKAIGCLHLLNKLRFKLDTKEVVTIYKSLIIPVLTYCSVLSIFNNKSRADRLRSIDSRAIRIKHACMFVRKCVDGKLCENFAEYFSLWSYEKRTRSNSISLNLPSIYFSGAMLSNKLPVQIRQLDSFEIFRISINTFFC